MRAPGESEGVSRGRGMVWLFDRRRSAGTAFHRLPTETRGLHGRLTRSFPRGASRLCDSSSSAASILHRMPCRPAKPRTLANPEKGFGAVLVRGAKLRAKPFFVGAVADRFRREAPDLPRPRRWKQARSAPAPTSAPGVLPLLPVLVVHEADRVAGCDGLAPTDSESRSTRWPRM
jgi:hypothetical protein